MSILIKGMEMPTSCGDCKAFVCYKQWAGDMGDCFCGITKEDAKAKEKNADCPLVPVPEHGRLIDADRLRHSHCAECTLYPDNCLGDECDWDSIFHIDHAPTIIPADPADKEEE